MILDSSNKCIHTLIDMSTALSKLQITKLHKSIYSYIYLEYVYLTFNFLNSPPFGGPFFTCVCSLFVGGTWHSVGQAWPQSKQKRHHWIVIIKFVARKLTIVAASRTLTERYLPFGLCEHIRICCDCYYRTIVCGFVRRCQNLVRPPRKGKRPI